MYKNSQFLESQATPCHPVPRKQEIMKAAPRLLLLLIVVFLMAASCGYHFSGEGPGPRPGLQRITIPVFENNTSEPGLESLFAGNLRREFILRSRLKVVPAEQAEAIFRGRVVSIHTSAVAHRRVEETIETRLYVTLDLRCEDAQHGTVLWQDPNYTYHRTYFENPDPIVSFENRRRALEFLAKEMAVRIHDRFLSNF